MVAPKSDLMGKNQDAADLHPVHWETADDEIHETDYFDELDRARTPSCSRKLKWGGLRLRPCRRQTRLRHHQDPVHLLSVFSEMS